MCVFLFFESLKIILRNLGASLFCQTSWRPRALNVFCMFGLSSLFRCLSVFPRALWATQALTIVATDFLSAPLISRMVTGMKVTHMKTILQMKRNDRRNGVPEVDSKPGSGSTFYWTQSSSAPFKGVNSDKLGSFEAQKITSECKNFIFPQYIIFTLLYLTHSTFYQKC